MAYDVGAIVRDTQQEFNLTIRGREGVERQGVRNRATPENLTYLLAALAEFTDDLDEWRAAMDADQDWRQRVLGTSGIEGLAVIDDDLDAWNRRLDEYIFQVSKAPPGDREDVLWSVTAPLLFGFYGGPTSTMPRGGADVATPFRIANMMLVSDEWQSEAFNAWQRETVQAAIDLATLIPRAAGAAVDAAFDIADLLRVAVPIGIGVVVVGALLRGRRRR